MHLLIANEEEIEYIKKNFKKKPKKPGMLRIPILIYCKINLTDFGINPLIFLPFYLILYFFQ